MTSKKDLQDHLRSAAIDCLQAERALSNSEKPRIISNIKKATKHLQAVTQNIKV